MSSSGEPIAAITSSGTMIALAMEKPASPSKKP